MTFSTSPVDSGNTPQEEQGSASEQPPTDRTFGTDADRRASSFRRLLSQLSGEYRNIHPRLRLINFILFFCPPLCANQIRTRIYRACGFKIGRRTLICGNMSLCGGPGLYDRLRLGQDCFVNSHIHFDLNDFVIIGDNVSIGHHVIFITSNHRIGPQHHRCGPDYTQPIKIENGCWIGANVTILPGVTIGSGCVVGAGALVVRDVPPNHLVVGVPAKIVRNLAESEAN